MCVYVCREIDRGSVYREIDIRECVCKEEKERDGREPVIIRVWLRMRVRVRVIWHFVRFFIFWHFVRDSLKHNHILTV